MKCLELDIVVPRYLAYQVVKRVLRKKYILGLSGLKLVERPMPKLPGPDWVLVKSRKAAICGSDLNSIAAEESVSLEPYCAFPIVLGHEGVGEVVGADVRGLEVGARVVADPILGCVARGIEPVCPACGEGKHAHCANFRSGPFKPATMRGFSADVPGNFSEYFLAHRSQCIPVPSAVSDDDAVMVDSIASSLDPAVNFHPPHGARVVVYGCGTIGLQLIQSLRALGFEGEVIAIYRHEFQRDLAEKLGATRLLNEREGVFEGLAKLYGFEVLKPFGERPLLDGGVDQVFDCVGSERTVNESLRILRPRGRLILVGTAGTLRKVDFSLVWFRELYISGSSMYSVPSQGTGLSALGSEALGQVLGVSAAEAARMRSYEMALRLLALGKLRGGELISHRFKLDQYREALDVAFDKGQARSVKVTFEF